MLALVTLAAGLTACSGSEHPLASEPFDATGQIALAGGAGHAGDTGGVRLADPERTLRVVARAGAGRITDVTAVDERGRYVRGAVAADGSAWRSTAPLAASARYTLRVSTERGDGARGRGTLTYRTAAAKVKGKDRLKVALGPDSGTYGVGQPLTVELSRSVRRPAERAVVERGLKVTSAPPVAGSWYWVSGRELHYRPRAYWPAGATVALRSTLEGVKVGKGVFAGASKPVRVRVGDRVEAVTDASAHRMTVYRNGRKLRSIPVTTGKPGFSTRNGKKVVLEQQRFVRMRGTSIGIPAGTADSYDLPVYWATRITWSGEYVHAAPWSVGSQGQANVSHGCVGMSTSNAQWFYHAVRPGDIVEVVRSSGERMAPFGNGFGDWNMSWEKWLRGSALTPGTPGGGAADVHRLRPGV